MGCEFTSPCSDNCPFHFPIPTVSEKKIQQPLPFGPGESRSIGSCAGQGRGERIEEGEGRRLTWYRLGIGLTFETCVHDRLKNESNFELWDGISGLLHRLPHENPQWKILSSSSMGHSNNIGVSNTICKSFGVGQQQWPWYVAKNMASIDIAMHFRDLDRELGRKKGDATVFSEPQVDQGYCNIFPLDFYGPRRCNISLWTTIARATGQCAPQLLLYTFVVACRCIPKHMC